MNRSYQVRVEATFGSSVKVGDQVRKGEKLGTAPGFKGTTVSPVNGIVISTTFDPDDHTFVIIIEATNNEE